MIKELENGFRYIELKSKNSSAKIALNGAQLFEYMLNGKNLLWVAKEAIYEDGISIRGGIPICWPWFGFNKENTSLPQHGFARNELWSIVDLKEYEAILKLEPTVSTKRVWNYAFELLLKINIQDNLTLELKTTNKDTKAFKITQALHTYFKISNIANVEILGLEQKPYLDALTWKKATQVGAIHFNGELDRVYQNIDKEILLLDKNQKISIKNSGSSSCVVWNPWIEKSSRLSQMSTDEYKEMLCIESANAFDDEKTILPNESHTLKAIITLC